MEGMLKGTACEYLHPVSLQLCNKVVEWNAKVPLRRIHIVSYIQQYEDYHRTKANCQCFVNDVLKVMGISIPSGGALSMYS